MWKEVLIMKIDALITITPQFNNKESKEIELQKKLIDLASEYKGIPMIFIQHCDFKISHLKKGQVAFRFPQSQSGHFLVQNNTFISDDYKETLGEI